MKRSEKVFQYYKKGLLLCVYLIILMCVLLNIGIYYVFLTVHIWRYPVLVMVGYKSHNRAAEPKSAAPEINFPFPRGVPAYTQSTQLRTLIFECPQNKNVLNREKCNKNMLPRVRPLNTEVYRFCNNPEPKK